MFTKAMILFQFLSPDSGFMTVWGPDATLGSICTSFFNQQQLHKTGAQLVISNAHEIADKEFMRKL